MRNIVLITTFSLVAIISKAQLSVQLAVSPQPPGALISWGTKDLTYIVAGQPGSPPRQAVIKATLTAADGTIAGATNLAKARVRLVGQGTQLFYAADVMPLDVMIFNGKYKQSLDKTGKLPSGSYQLCVQLVTPVDFVPISEERCRTFNLAAYQLPIPMLPANEDVMEAEKAQTAITFRWTPVTPTPTEVVKYIVTVFEVLDKQTPMQALRSNQPLLTKEIIGTTQYIWQPQLSFIKTKVWDDPNKTASALDSIDVTKFIWTIQTVNMSNIPFGDGNVNADGISEPNLFVVIKDSRIIKTGPPARVIYLNNVRNRQ
jgi:hypothetical protein